jgi:hypothetical protein
MNKIKIILSYLFGFILSISIVLTIILIVLKFSVFKPNYIKNELEKVDYYNSIYTEVIDGMKDYIAPTGLPESILDEVVSKDEVKTEVNNYINALIIGKKYEVNTSMIEERVKKSIDEYLVSHNVRMDETDEFSKFINDLETVYSNEVKLYNVLDNYVSLYPKAQKYINISVIVLFIISVVLLVLMFYLNKTMICSSIMSSGIILILIRIFIMEDISIDNVTLFNDYFSLFIRNILTFFSNSILIIGIIGLLMGIFVSLFSYKNK